jgi:regulator of PEP synthase PpsR (kinase-PPPase family)
MSNEAQVRNDNRLIELAKKTPYTEWSKIDNLITQAKTEWGKEELEYIQTKKCHIEEYTSGNF